MTGRISDELRFMTVRILTSKKEDTNWTGSGTGFLYVLTNGDKAAPILMTNKHVIDGAVVIGLTFHVTADENKTAIPGPGRLISFRSDQLPIVYHPQHDVDLAGIALTGLVDHCRTQEGWQPFIKCLAKSHLPTPEMLKDFGSLEDVIMVGYPTGIVDEVNNFPIVRRGITSTPYAANYKGKKEFLADIPVYGGSSGSPVFVVNEGSFTTPNAIVMGTRFALLGVLYAGHTETVTGEIVAEPIPTSIAAVAKSRHMINLGLCIKSELVEDLGQQIPW